MLLNNQFYGVFVICIFIFCYSMKTKKIYKKRQNMKKARLAKTKPFHTKKTAKKHNRTGCNLGDKLVAKLGGGFFGRLFGKTDVEYEKKKIIEPLEDEIAVLFLSFDFCINYCYDKDKIKNSTIGQWSFDCSKINYYKNNDKIHNHNNKIHKCNDLLKQIQKVNEIVNNVLKNKNISNRTKNAVSLKRTNAFEELEKKRAEFLLSNEKVLNDRPTDTEKSVAEESKIKENEPTKMISAEKQMELDEENFVLQKNDEDVLDLFMDNAFQTISFYKDCKRNFFIKRNCNSYNENKDNLDNFYGDIFQSENIQNEPENFYGDIFQSENINEVFEINTKIPENNISKETNKKINLIMNTTEFLTKTETTRQTVLNFLSEYKRAKNIYEKYEVFEKYSKMIVKKSFPQKSKSLSKLSKSDSYKTPQYDVDPI